MCQVGNIFKTYHANLLQKFEERQPIPPHDIILSMRQCHSSKNRWKEHMQYIKKVLEMLRT